MGREAKLLTDALKREREQQPNRLALEQYSVWAYSFNCVACGARRKFEESRDGWSNLCVHCARRIGLEE